jgi:single-strand DNA-binding protein
MLDVEVVEMTQDVSHDPTGIAHEDAAGQLAGEPGSPDAGGTVDDATARAPAARRPALTGRSDDNEVTLRGRVSSAPVVRELPSGAVISTFRVSVPRARTVMTAGSSQSVDWVDCAAWSARTRRRVDSWAVGDEVELSGSLRRRFFRAGVAPSTRLELEVLDARRSRPGDRPSP